MSYTIQLIKKDEQITRKWSGGDTTQLAIYPKDAQYTKQNFKWRISSAVVEAEESEFTPLPNINRLIMVIEGEMTLKHDGHHHVHLTPYDQDRFNGGWTTRSYGKVRDFNLMLAEGCNGELEAITIEEEGNYEIVSPSSSASQIVEAFYCTGGPIHICIHDQQTIELEEGDLLQLSRESVETRLSIRLLNRAKTQANIIRASVVF